MERNFAETYYHNVCDRVVSMYMGTGLRSWASPFANLVECNW